METKAWQRRDVLKAILSGSVGLGAAGLVHEAGAADVNWLAEVQTPPVQIPRKEFGYFEPLLMDDNGKAIRSLDAWKFRRKVLRRRWLEFLGPMPEKRPAVELKILKEDRPEGCIRQLVRYESEPGQSVEGYLLRPDKPSLTGKRPGIVALHQTNKNSIDEIAGLKGSPIQHLAPKLCRRGFVVFCPRCYLWQDAANYMEAVDRFRARHPKTLGMHKMLYDAMRGVDVLESLADVDSKRIGACGHSLGGKESLYLAAFDERIQAAVASDGGVGLKFTNWEDVWYLGKGINAPGFKLNHHQLLALIAPRPFLVIGGDQKGPSAADGDRTWPFLEAALPVYHLYGRRARLGLFNHRKGHTIPPEAYRRLAEWLEAYLA